MSLRKHLIFGWTILSLATLTYARAIAVSTSPLVAFHHKRKNVCPRRFNNNTSGRDERYHGTDILDPSKSFEERFPVRGGAAASSAAPVETEKAWLDGAKNSLASALAAAFSKTILAPFDTIKTLQQFHQSSANAASLSLMEAAKIIMERPGGFLNFYVSANLESTSVFLSLSC